MSMERPRDLREWQRYVERQLRTVGRGTSIAIAHGTDAAQEVRNEVDTYKDLTPAAPIEITYQTALYIDANRRQRGNATFDFPDVVFATNGTPISVDRYEIWGQDQGLVPLQPFQLMNSSTSSSVYATNLKPGSAWKFRIRARANDIIKAGLFSADQSVTITADTTPPPQTTAPVATAVSGGVKLVWDGLAVGGVAMPGDLDHVDVAFGMAASPTTIIDSFPPGGSFTIVPKSAYNTVHYFRIRAVDTSGNVGPWSVQATAIPVPLVDVDIILSAIDGAKITLGTVASAALVDQAVTAAKLKDGAVDQLKLAQAVNDAIGQGTSAYASISGINSSISTLTTSVNGKNKIKRDVVDATGTTGFVQGDTWEKWTTLATGGKLLQSWRFNGTAWIAELMDPTYLPLVDIGAGTFGTLNGGRIEAASIVAQQLAIGDFSNLIPNAQLQSGTTGWTVGGGTIEAVTAASGLPGLKTTKSNGTGEVDAYAQFVDVIPGETVRLSYTTEGNWDSGNAAIYAQKMNAAGVVTSFNPGTTGANTPGDKSYVVTIPSDAVRVRFRPYISATSSAGTYAIFSNMMARRMSPASLILNLGVEQLTASAASISSAVVDKIWNEVLYSRKITTDMLVVTAGTNMIPDPTFTQPESRAKKTANNATGWDTYVSSGGIQAIRYGNTTPSWPSVGYLNLFDYDSTPGVADKTGWLPVLAGEKYEFSGRLYASDASINTKMYVTYLMADGTTSGWSSPLANPNIAPDGGPNRLPVWEFTVPANAIKMGARLEHRGTAGWVSLYGDSVYLRKKVDANLIVDGGVIAKHLTVTDEMWTKILHFKKLTGDEIDANSLTADTGWIGVLRGGILINDAVTTSILKADAITSKHTITGAKFQTTTTASRGIKFDVNGLKMWDAGGLLTMDLNAGTGYATMTGRVRTAPDGSPGVVLIPPVESDDGKTMALWFTPDTAVLAGGITAGMWISNPATTSTPGQVNIRGQQYGGVKLWDAVQFDSNNTSVPQLFSNHGTGFQMTAYNGNLLLAGSGGETRISSLNNTIINVGSLKQVTLQNAGSPYSRTNGAAANMILFTDGNIFKVSSALKYKIDPQPMEIPDSLLDDVTVKHWIDVGMAERFAEQYGFEGERDEQAQREFDALSLQRIPGAIAEDVEAAGGEQFVTRDLEGELDGLMYDRYALARTEVLKRRVAAQALEIAELRQMVEELVASLSA